MSYLKDFLELKVSLRTTLLAIFVKGTFIYLCLYFVNPEFITKTIFHIPILFSLCVAFVLTIGWNIAIIFSDLEAPKFEEIREARSILGTVITVFLTILIGMMFGQTTVRYYIQTLVEVSAVVCLFWGVVFYFGDKKPANKKPGQNPPQ